MTTALTERHVEHVHKKNERLEAFKSRVKDRAARVTKGLVAGGEVLAGSYLAGVIQGLHKGPPGTGPKIAGMPTDLAVGAALLIGGAAFSGEDWSSHLTHTGVGFVAGFVNDAGVHLGERKKVSGKWFPERALPAGGGAPKAAGQFDATHMAEALLRERAKNAG